MPADTTEQLLRARFGDPGALTAALSMNAGRCLITFGARGRSPRVVIQVSGDVAEIISSPSGAGTVKGMDPEPGLSPQTLENATAGGGATTGGLNAGFGTADNQIGQNTAGGETGGTGLVGETNTGATTLETGNRELEGQNGGAGTGTGGAPAPQLQYPGPLDPEKLTRAELLDAARERGLDAATLDSENGTKAALADAINAAAAAK